MRGDAVGEAARRRAVDADGVKRDVTHGVIGIGGEEGDLGAVGRPDRPDDVEGITELAGLAAIGSDKPERAVAAEDERTVGPLQRAEAESRIAVVAVERGELAQCPLRLRPIVDRLGGIDFAAQLVGAQAAGILQASHDVLQLRRLRRDRLQEGDRFGVVAALNGLQPVDIARLERFEFGVHRLRAAGGIPIAGDLD